MNPHRCAACQAFIRPNPTPCLRCERKTSRATRLAARATRALDKARRTSIDEGWKPKKLRRALFKLRKRFGMGRSRWESIVKRVFGAATHDLVDPRQMFLFGTERTEPSCPTESPSPSLSQSA